MIKDLKDYIAIYPYHEWKIIEDSFELEHNYRNETVFSLANGYMGLRGTFEEGYPFPADQGLEGTFINGFYESETIRYGELAYAYPEKTQTMLNVTNGKIVRIYIDGEQFNMLEGSMEQYQRVLDLQKGTVTRSLIWQSPKGKKLQIVITRLVSFTNKHLATFQYELTPLNFAGEIKIEALIDGKVENSTAKTNSRIDYGPYGRVLIEKNRQFQDDVCALMQVTKQTQLSLLCATDHHFEDQNMVIASASIDEKDVIGKSYTVNAKKRETIRFTKNLVYLTSSEYEVNDMFAKAITILSEAKLKGFTNLKEEQAAYLEQFWYRTDVEIKGNIALQQGIRFNMYHLLQSAGRDGKTSMAAKGLSGEGYEGHVFWDTEMYGLPFFTFNNPQIAKRLLEFRYNTLNQARQRARELSIDKGACYPWRTINGQEASAYYPAGTAQVHINADIAFAVQNYMDATDDHEFTLQMGAEMLIETARFWYEFGAYIETKDNKFCINGVTGPDEFTVLADNNCFTNLLARENLWNAYNVVKWMEKNYPVEFAELSAKIGLEDDEKNQWKRAADQMYIPYSEDLEIFPQDDGFLYKKPWDIANTPIKKYPLLDHHHPLVVYRHQVSKQADLILGLCLLSHMFTKDELQRNFDFYEKVTVHESSLSACIFSIVASRIGYYDKSYEYFMTTSRLDLDDYHRNTHAGIHTANMAGTWMCIVNGFAGMQEHNDKLCFSPYLPEEWDEYSFKVSYKGRLIKLTIAETGTTYELLAGKDIEIIHENGTMLLQMKPKIQAAIFDLDGVIVDTAKYHYLAWKRLADQLGFEFTEKDNERLKGVSRMSSLEILLEVGQLQFDEVEKLRMAEQKNDWYVDYISKLEESEILLGVKDFILRLKNSGMKIAIGSASKNTLMILNNLNILDLFDAVVDGNKAIHAKPDPEVFLLAAEELQVDPTACIVFEDAFAGVEAAKSAGMYVVGIGDLSVLKEADDVIDSFVEPRFDPKNPICFI
ncbi:beta-phosphoglucomutase [Paenibacillus sp. B-A-8]|uniref:beta-phosphoglucomutase n=1 Tax=Paenibacillus sp. B-A-8 TaxID=3400419 RepID=UPI003B015E02